jgi:DNA-binding response OmpR family regulator
MLSAGKDGQGGGSGPMSRLAYETAETLVYDPVSGNRATTRSALYSLGFRRIEIVATLENLAETIANRPPDLAVCEVQGAEEELCGLIQKLRQGDGVFNPFVVIIVTAWEKSGALVSRIIDSGADDLLLRPFSPAVLGQRIRAHVEKRKAFVITSEYVGPDRRKDSARASNVELFNPPNSLRMKAWEGLSAEQVSVRLDRELKAAREVLLAEKLRRDAFQICVLWRLMHYQAPGTARFEVDLSKLKLVARGIAQRCAGTEFDTSLEWCEAVLAALEGLELGVDRQAAMQMLGHAALNLNQSFAPDSKTPELLAEIDATVALIHARTETALAS